jgi:hypothetical protein
MALVALFAPLYLGAALFSIQLVHRDALVDAKKHDKNIASNLDSMADGRPCALSAMFQNFS